MAIADTMVVCPRHIEQYQLDLERAISEMSGNLPIRSESDTFEKCLQDFGVSKETMDILRENGCCNVEGLKNMEETDVDDLENMKKLQIKYLKKAIASLKGEQVSKEESNDGGISVEDSPVVVDGAEGNASIMVAEGGAAQTAGGKCEVKKCPVTAKNVSGSVKIGGLLK